ncbi:EAL domain-containing response regulator [Cellvibrio japonicus]|uniref:Response regulator n=1 Tax=Cellvibrio japonicus (strain Ueda107) TaxID=498211 RepID=B3PBX4_CELJU|nr:EAL domain-containing response regulator [Cellvibrio japonicus]ACE85361.1 response regulator [Cellvibrio japonicus Ueda107]QEI11789.1 EAL domain-containing response regulator [Cellvibrio japonicus]QEI15363.1 EAL domain-containing response regulator [Cellvibrio japonicus]QEI18942.1 EAL domain-containing response regulator [Cellvibrio japonicus]
MISFNQSPLLVADIQLSSEILAQGVLVVDDSGLQRASAVNCLQQLGIDKIYEAGDGQDALTILYSLPQQPAVMLLDLELPGLDGIEVLQRLQGAIRRPEIILVSSSDEVLIGAVATMAEAIGIPLLGAYRKPMTPDMLARALERYGQWHPQTKPVAQPRPAPGSDQLQQAIAQRRIIPYYQPKLNLQQPQLAGWEALARWPLANGFGYSPAEFIPQAEREGKIAELTLSLLEQVLEDIQTWQAQGIHTSVAINLSASSLTQVDLANDIIQRVAAAGINPRQLSFEMTESALIMDLPAALATISRLRLKGFGFSIDDYGTGFSSMQQLSRFPFTELKIDRSFVQEAPRQQHVREILQSAVDMGRRMGITSVAEGVETLEELQLLRAIGCRQVQGFLIAHPMPAAQIPLWLAQELNNKLTLCRPQNMETPASSGH